MFGEVSAVVGGDGARGVRESLVAIVELIVTFDVAPLPAFQYFLRDLRLR
jgi:hypothetical protein